VVGHVEVPHTDRGEEQSSDIPAPASDPANLEALARAGFHIATLAGNHLADIGPAGIEDTIAKLHSVGIKTTGAGPNLESARSPAIVQRKDVKLGFLSYNCVGPRSSWAADNRPGCAYVHVITHYELDNANPGGQPAIYTFAEPSTLEAMEADIESLRKVVDVAIVALHKGLTHTPAALAMYERQVARAAIEAGADIVVGHHAHILQGIEIYKGKPIFHGLGNFVTVTRALSIENNPSPQRLAWARRRRELFGFEPDPDYPTYPFHPEAKNAIIATCTVDLAGVRSAGFIPCWINKKGQPEVLGPDQRGKDVAAYVEKITHEVNLNTKFEWNGNRVIVN
jgi:hypothetical protein